jgi:hypothetical protein
MDYLVPVILAILFGAYFVYKEFWPREATTFFNEFSCARGIACSASIELAVLASACEL